MAKQASTIYVCENCGNESLQWLGRCPSCGEWNSLREVRGLKTAKGRTSDRPPGEVTSLQDIRTAAESRSPTGKSEFDRTLGGGIVAGSVVLIGGEPGIGKSTLLLELARQFPNLLYVSGEESDRQIKLRADRLGIKQAIGLLIETDVQTIATVIKETRPELVIIDSIQTLYDSAFPSTPGSIIQVRESALAIAAVAKTTGIPIILVGHVTKEGSIAGPRTLEHLVDVVIYLEGERNHTNRILRTVKNRFGPTDEIGLFEMKEDGLVEVTNPSSWLLAQRQVSASGSVVTVALEGSRPLLVEIQSLVNPTVFGYPKRTSSGFDLNRLNLLVAVLQKRAAINLANYDIYLNVVGGLQLREPATDLAVLLSLVSTFKGIALPPDLAVFGEVGLTGEIRLTKGDKIRAAEAKRLGFNKLVKARSVKEAIKELFSSEMSNNG